MATDAVAVIGLGGMGAGMARALLRAGSSVTVFNRSGEKADPLVRDGALRAATAAEAGVGADVLLLSLSDETVVEEMFFGEVAPNLGHGTIVVDTTTVSPSYAAEATARLAEIGVDRVEACVLGNHEMAGAGRLRVFTAGNKAAVDRVEPVLSILAQELRYLGEAGRASALKLAMNLLLGVQTAGLAEAADFAEVTGLGRDLLLDVVLNSAWGSPVLSFRAEFMRRRAYEPAGFRTELMHKDLDLALRHAGEHRLPLPLVQRAADRFATAIDRGQASADAAVIAEVRTNATC